MTVTGEVGVIEDDVLVVVVGAELSTTTELTSGVVGVVEPIVGAVSEGGVTT